MTSYELDELFGSVGWSCPTAEQLESAIRNSTKAFIVRHNGKPAAKISLLGDVGMHWFVKDFIVRPEFQGQMIGTLLFRFCENYIKSTMKPNRKVCIDLRASKGKEPFYEKLGFEAMTAEASGCGMEKMIEK
ncbi:MAG: GNAT family N-acetyltransferase [Oscillospiraceae bacterium]|nr:GNAT family N-acetyltransferase [Oscillospiraceae bacterium]